MPQAHSPPEINGVPQIPLSRASLGWYKSGVPIGMFKAMEMMEVDVEEKLRSHLRRKLPRRR